ncbi:MAG TPA: alpha/beta hydrolase [Flavisolibacter sp.]|jgi:pimeloyl-ACP methyl ester carboxylesterase
MQHLILLHGALGSSEQLKTLEQSLSDNYQVHIPDLPGHGGTGLQQEFSIHFFAQYLEEYIEQHNLKRASVFGYSMGGYVAMYLAVQRPELISKIITLATKWTWSEEITAREVKMLQPEVIEQKLPQFAQALVQRHAPDDWKELLHKTADMMLQMGKNNPLKHEDLAQVTTPSLIMLGDRDKMVSLQETVEAYQHIPSAQMAVLPKTSHPIEQVDIEMISFFIRRFIS